MAEMLIYRLEDLSMYFFIKDLFQDAGNLVTVVDSFPNDPNTVLAIPTISIDAGRLDEYEFYEMGNRDLLRVRTWYIDIFAKNKSQRDDFAYRILNESENGISVYDYNQGFPPSIAPDRVEHLRVVTKGYEPIPVMLDESEKLYFRGQVIIDTQNDTV